MVRDLFRLIYPSVCINCNLSLISGENYLCTKCKIDLPLTNDSFEEQNDLLKKFSYNSFVRGAASFLYFNQKGITQKLLHRLKYDGQSQVGRMLGSYFSEQVRNLNVDFILPVPIHRTKLKKRGYNQSAEIAHGISEKLSLEVREDILSRIFQSSSQTKKSKLQRWNALENVYSEASELVAGSRVLVVDDVITTGATIGMLCDRLAERRVGEIYVGSIARGK